MENADGSATTYSYDTDGNVTSVVDGEGNATLREYDHKGNLVSFTDAGNLTTTMTYDSHGNVLSVHGTEDRNASYTYNSQNLMTSMTDSAGMKTTYSYNGDGQLTRESVEGFGYTEYTYKDGLVSSIRDFNGNVTSFEYDAMGNRTMVTDALGNVTRSEYDALGRLLKSTDALGNVTRYTYDYTGALSSVTDALGGIISYQYDRAGRLVRETYPDGTGTKYSYDSMGRCTRITYADGTYTSREYDAVGNVVKETLADGTVLKYNYDKLGQRLSETDGEGSKVTYAYYPNGKLHKISYPDGSAEIYTYSQAWKVNSVTDRTGHTTSYQYDSKGNLTMARDALGNERRYSYDIYGRLLSETDANGNTTTYTYDANSNCISKTNAMGVTAHMEYDAGNRMTRAYTKTGDGTVYSISYTYDALGRVTSSTDEMGSTTRYAYDALGNLVSATDADGVETQTAEYDSMGRATTVTDALGVTTGYEYDAMGQMIRAVETLNGQTEVSTRTTTYTYDSLGRMTSVTDPMQGVTAVTYDRRGNISTLTDANGGTTSYEYDSMAQLTSVISPLGNKTTYTYDAGGLLAESKNARGQETSYTYDAVGRITAMTDGLGTTTYTYDPNGNVLSVTDKQGTIRREYDKLNRVTKYTDHKGDTVTYGYDEIGNLITLTYPGGEIVRLSYYKNGWLETVVDGKGNATRYSYDARGNLTHTIRPNGTEEIRTYNEAGLLTSQRDIRSTEGGEEEVLTGYSYTYDASGNITAIEGTETTDTEEGISRLTGAEMTYDAENRLLTYNGEELVYDADGNMTRGPVNGVMTDLVYDCRNRLVSAGGVTYTYDAENNRVKAETDSYTEEYFNDTVSASLSRVLEIKVTPKNGITDTSAGNTTAGSTTTVCIYGNGLIYERTGDIYQYHHYNHLGSTMKLTGSKGEITASFTYGTYGELLSGDNRLTKFLYNGRCGVTTDDNGLYYMRQRYYNPEIKHFVNQDILTGSLGNSQSLNRYSYVQGNPVSYTDPFGLSPLSGMFDGTTFAHCVFGLLGTMPGIVGITANAVDAIVYAVVDKDYYNAALSGFCAASFGFGSLAKMTAGSAKCSKMFKVASSACGMIGNGLEFVSNAQNAMELGFGMYDKYVIHGEAFGWDTVLEAAEFTMAAAGTFGAFGGLMSDTHGLHEAMKQEGWCFVAGTLIKTKEGNKAIEEIEVGDLVYARNTETGEEGYKEVVRLFPNSTQELIHVAIGDTVIDTTPAHRFWVEGKDFLPARDLQVGDRVLTASGELKEITSIERESLEEPVPVYNFEVKDWHTYYVSGEEILVHNTYSHANQMSPEDAERYLYNPEHGERMDTGSSSTGDNMDSHKPVYRPSKKHDPRAGWGSVDPIPDIETGQSLLDTAYSSSQHKQLYNIYDGKLIKFQPDTVDDGWHAYLIKNTASEIPADVLRKMLKDKKITRVQYNDFIKNNKR